MPEKDTELNVCCPYFNVEDCADTTEHAHLACLRAMGAISIATVRKFCIGDWDKCINFNEIVSD